MKYPNVWPIVLIRNDRSKLVLDMLSFNALLTSSTRLSQFEPPTVGATTTNFFLNSIRNLLAIRTYFDQKSVDKALELAKMKKLYPSSVTVLWANFSGSIPNSTVPSRITFAVRQLLSHSPTNPTLIRSLLWPISINIGKSKDILVESLALFADYRCIPILKNGALNQLLGKSFTFMHPYITITNKSVEDIILQTFRYLN
ncbi:hypothetical protein G6F43_004699 [Rhizopus delemar]|nr:hypothetical protein G6F43_004699 [Rhizopus delemar]